MTRKDKIQCLLISHLLEEGQIELTLPDGIVLEVGISKENKHGELKVKDNYSWIIASQDDRIISMDSYNLGLRFGNTDNKIVFEDESIDENGKTLKILSVI